MSVPTGNSTTATMKPIAAMCLGHFAAPVQRVTETLGLGILIGVVASVRHVHLSTAAVMGNVIMKQGSQSASKYFQLVCYDTCTLSPKYTLLNFLYYEVIFKYFLLPLPSIRPQLEWKLTQNIKEIKVCISICISKTKHITSFCFIK